MFTLFDSRVNIYVTTTLTHVENAVTVGGMPKDPISLVFEHFYVLCSHTRNYILSLASYDKGTMPPRDIRGYVRSPSAT